MALTPELTVGHYLNLPVVEADGRLVAIVDVLKLTYATLEQVCPTDEQRYGRRLRLECPTDEPHVAGGGWRRR